MAVEQQQCRVSAPAMTVLIIEKEEDIRSALGDLLEDAGYAVAEAESLREAAPLLSAAAEPLVMIVGDARPVGQADLRFFTTIAANPVSKEAFAFFPETLERWRVPSLVESLARCETQGVDLPYELALFLALVADAAAQACA